MNKEALDKYFRNAKTCSIQANAVVNFNIWRWGLGFPRTRLENVDNRNEIYGVYDQFSLTLK